MALVRYLRQDRGNLTYCLKQQQRGHNKSAKAGKSDCAQDPLFVTGLSPLLQPSLSAGPQTRHKVSASHGILRFMAITNGIWLKLSWQI